MAGFVVLFPGLRGQEIRYRPRIDWHDPGRARGGRRWSGPSSSGRRWARSASSSPRSWARMLEAGSISSLSYAEKLFQLPLGLFVAGITVPIFPLLSEQVAANAPERVKATVDFALRLMGFLMVPATVGIILLRYPIIGLIFEHGKFTADDTARTAWALLFLCLGSLRLRRPGHSHAGLLRLSRHAHAGEDQRGHGGHQHRSCRTCSCSSWASGVWPSGCTVALIGQLRGAHLAARAEDRRRWDSGRSSARCCA